VILALAIVLPAWAASLIVAVAWAAIAGVLAFTGKQNLQASTPPVPSHTAEVVRQDVRSLAGQLKRGK
jgi:Putative Actinobacterial Holin-X, holin superfamily III